jgi:glycosyltransferase involved in cell wall biosynthesis
VNRLLLHAPNVHQGGGRALLSSLLHSLGNEVECVLLSDARLDIPGPVANVTVISFPASIAGRWAAEWRLRSLAKKDDVVLCLGNLPPLFALPSRTCLFLQNRYLCQPVPLRGFGMRTRLRITLERFWVRHFLRNVSQVIVQTPSMRESVRHNLRSNASVVPFAAAPPQEAKMKESSQHSARRFLYPATADPHKNHAILLEAWRLLRADGMDVELHLTVSSRAPLAREIDRLYAREGLKIINHGEVDSSRLGELYDLSDAVIFPSTLESFGLPLAEARARNIPVIAAELDFVRDVVEPAQTFDPASSVSIARAVRRFVGAPEQPVSVLSPAEFVRWLVSEQV